MIMGDELKIGLEGEARVVVSDQNTAVAHGSGSVFVFATPAMIGLMEKAALSSVDPFLGSEHTTVGTKVEVRHLAATPPGMTVVAKSRLVEVEGNRLVFEVEAHDDLEVVGSGRHERFIVKRDKFLKRVAEKGGSKAVRKSDR
jgi:predicted thioesterase